MICTRARERGVAGAVARPDVGALRFFVNGKWQWADGFDRAWCRGAAPVCPGLVDVL